MLTRFSLLASFSVSYFMMLGIIKTTFSWIFCLIPFLVNVGWYLHWMRDDHDGDSVPPSAILSDCWATWSETTVGRSTWIFLKCRTRLFLFSLFTNHFTHALYINKCYKINLLKKYFVVMIRDRKQYIKFHLIGNKYETKRFLTDAMFMFSRWWKSLYEMTFPCKMS